MQGFPEYIAARVAKQAHGFPEYVAATPKQAAGFPAYARKYAPHWVAGALGVAALKRLGEDITIGERVRAQHHV